MNIDSQALLFARAHISRYYVSDFFPQPDVLAAIWSDWTRVNDLLTRTPLKDQGRGPRLMGAPKSIGGFRVVHDPNPLDALAYTAAAYAVAPIIEERRASMGDHVCSYRLDVNPNGRFFDESHHGFNQYTNRARNLANTHSHVLLTDISAFYNTIYLHRIQSAIELCDSALGTTADAIHEFLLNMNGRVSIGIPVGPAASIVFAETVLLDVDQWIHDQGFSYVRYVDDFRVFSNSRIDLIDLLNGLSSYLYQSHRLSLSDRKTKILDSSQFIAEELESPAAREGQILHEQIAGAIASDGSVAFQTAYFDAPERWKAMLPTERAQLLSKVMDTITGRESLDLGLARHLLRRAKHARIRAIIPKLLENLDFFAPVIRDVCLYLDAVLDDKSIEWNIGRLEGVVSNQSIITRVPFCSMWMRWLLTRRQLYLKSKIIDGFVGSDTSPICFQARRARLLGHESWARSLRPRWRELGPADRSSVLLSAETLGRSERNVWMDEAMNSDDPIDRLTAAYVKGAGSR